MDEIKIAGIVFEHAPEDWGIWFFDGISKEDNEAIMNILDKYTDQGCSVRNVYDELSKL